MSAAEIDITLKTTVTLPFGVALTNIVQRSNPKRRLKIGVIPTWRRTLYNRFFCVPYSYGILKIMVVVKFIRAISVLRPSDAIFSLGAFEKKIKVFTALCGTLIANILISSLKHA